MIQEQKLWQEVVLKAVRDATADDPQKQEDRHAKRQADAWLRTNSRDFRDVCMMADLDPDFIRDSYVAGRVDPEILRNHRFGGKDD